VHAPIRRREQQLLVNLPHLALVLCQRAVHRHHHGIGVGSVAGRSAVGGRQRLSLGIILRRWFGHDFSALSHTTKQPS
jgi:hypothetical protein